MNRRESLKTIAGVSALTLLAENAVAMPSQAQLAKTDQTIKDSPWAGKMNPAYLNVISHADYDRMHVSAGCMVPERTHMFSQPIGSLLPGQCPECGSAHMQTEMYKSILHTNMYRGNQLPPPESRAVQRIVFLFSPLMLKNDRDRLVTKSFWEFRLTDKIVGRAPLAWSPVEGELTDLFEFDGKVPKRTGRNERSLSPGQYVHLERPVEILPMQQFSFELQTEPFVAEGDIDMYVLLDGLGAFAVQ